MYDGMQANEGSLADAAAAAELWVGRCAHAAGSKGSPDVSTCEHPTPAVRPDSSQQGGPAMGTSRAEIKIVALMPGMTQGTLGML